MGKKEKDKNKDNNKDKENDTDDDNDIDDPYHNEDDNNKEKEPDNNDNDDQYDNAGPIVKVCDTFVQYDEISVKIKCKKGKCSFACLKGFDNINQKSSECVNGQWSLDVHVVQCESKDKKGYGRK